MKSRLESNERNHSQATNISWLETDEGKTPRGESGSNCGLFKRLSDALLPEYRLVRQISSGAFSNVYEAIESRLGRRVAVKVLSPFRSDDAIAVQKFYKEARVVARLEQHPNIVRIYNIDEKEGFRFFTMNFATGGSLRDRLNRSGEIDATEVVRMIMQLLEALQFIHENGVVHGDIKPENLVLDEEGQVILTDFGISRQAHSEVDGGHAKASGTPAYMSPEQAHGREPVYASDLYSVGVMMYELLSGRLPFRADDPAALLLKHVYEEAVPLSVLVPALDPELAVIVRQLMEKLPERRPGSAAAVIYQLRHTRPFRDLQARQRRKMDPGMEDYTAPAKDDRGGQAASQTSEPPVDVPVCGIEISAPESRGFAGWIWAHAKWAGVMAGAILAGVILVELQGIHGQPSATPITPQAPVVALPADESKPPSEPGEQAQVKPVPDVAEIPKVELQRDRKPDRALKAPRTETRRFVADSGIQVSRAIEDLGAALNQASAQAQELASWEDRAAAPKALPSGGEVRSYPVSHDHVKGSCRGRLILHPDRLEFASEKEKDSRVWDYDQVRNVKLKGQSGLHFDSTEKDIKKLGFASRSYRFDFSDPSSARDLANVLQARGSLH